MRSTGNAASDDATLTPFALYVMLVTALASGLVVLLKGDHDLVGAAIVIVVTVVYLLTRRLSGDGPIGPTRLATNVASETRAVSPAELAHAEPAHEEI